MFFKLDPESEDDMLFQLDFSHNFSINPGNFSQQMQKLLSEYQSVTQALISQDWAEQLLVPTLTKIISLQVETKAQVCRQKFELVNLFSSFEKWHQQIVYRFFYLVVNEDPLRK
jgi:hypothetical protein